MSIELLPYGANKATAAPWLPSVPSHWSVLPNRAVFSEVINRGHAGEQMLSVTISAGVVSQMRLLSE